MKSIKLSLRHNQEKNVLFAWDKQVRIENWTNRSYFRNESKVVMKQEASLHNELNLYSSDDHGYIY